MQIVSVIAVALIGIIHLLIAAVEMFFWQVPKVHERLGFTPEVAKQVAPIVNNAGLYNTFIAAGLLWGAFAQQLSVQVFFLTCVIIAGLYGAVTLKPTTLFLQTIPATIALVLTWVAYARL